MKTTNYFDTFIEVAEDCPVEAADVPPERTSKTVVRMQYEMIMTNPYSYTSDDVLFNVYSIKQNIPAAQQVSEREKFFSKGRPCLLSSALGKRYGWGIHFDADGKIAMCGVESNECKKFATDQSLDHLKAMRSGRS